MRDLKRGIRRSAGAVLLALVALPVAGCGLLEPDVWEDRQQQLDRGRDRWEDAAVVAYRFTSVTSCECIPGFVGAVVTEVEEGRVTAVTPLEAAVMVPREQWDAFPTPESLFARIQAAIARRAHHFDVAYDPVLGYPTRVNLDLEEQVADDEILVHVSDLTVLERAP